MRIDRILTRSLAGLLSLLLLIFLIPFSSVLAAASLSISVSGKTEVGSTITVSVSASGDGPYSGYDGSFKSDGANFLDYLANIPNGGVLVTASFT